LLVDIKTRLVNLRNEGWAALFQEVKDFCVAKKIKLPDFSELRPRWGRSRLDDDLITKEHHYRVDTFLAALEWLNDLALCYIEKAIFRALDPEKIKRTFQSMKDRKMSFPHQKRPRSP